MILTTRGKYAIAAIVDMVEFGNNKPVSLSSISKRQNISLSYLEQIFADLRKAKIVSSVKGPGGGYILSKKIDDVTAEDVILATGEQIKMTSCSNKNQSCSSNGAKCKTHHLWRGLEDTIYKYFRSVSITKIGEVG